MKELLSIAFSQFGVKEIVGLNHNPIILNYFHEIGHKWVKDDETAWCSAFVNWCALKAGLERSDKLDARSWLKVGQEVTKPMPGDIVVFWRNDPNSWQGHVAIYVGESKTFVYALGGNQNNEVNVSAYHKTRLLGYRRLNKLTN